MRHCEDCNRASRDLAYNLFNPACLECGARVLWFLQRMRIPQQQKVERLRKSLADWVAFGHPEPQLRQLAERDWREWARERDPGH